MKRIKGYSKTHGNKYILVSEQDYDLVYKHRWNIQKFGNTYYAMTKMGGKKVSMHRYILKPEPTLEVDHMNHNGLDNRRENIRVVTKAENMRNRQKTKGNRRRYKGVYFDTRVNKWVAFVNSDNKRKYLGQFKTAREAAIAFNEAALKYYGPNTWLNKIVDKRKKTC